MVTNLFEIQLRANQFYECHPYMLPFVGKNYISAQHKKLLLVGESHYMPQESMVHHDVDGWYYGTPQLSCDERSFCNTVGTRECKSGNFGKVIERCLQSVFPINGNAWEEVASINYFQRPADFKENIAKLWKKTSQKDIITDRKVALENLLFVMEILRPDLVVFLSSFSCKHSAEPDYKKWYGSEFWEWTGARGIEYIYTNHPSSQSWHNKMDCYWKAIDSDGNHLKAKEFFAQWLRDNWI